MHAMLLDTPGQALRPADAAPPAPGPSQVLLRVRACGVCRTDLHIIDGELTEPKLPLILGHEIVGVVVERGRGAERFVAGDRVGVPWLGWTCGVCDYCRSGRENLCDAARFTGYQIDGGYAELAVADERFCFPIPAIFSDAEAAPLLCAGLIGYRSLVAAGDAKRLGLYGFGAAAHLIAQVARHQGQGMRSPSSLHRVSAPSGRAVRTRARRSRLTGRSSSRQSGHWSRRRCAPWSRVAP